MTNRKCHDALDRVYFYLDGELTWYKRFQVKRHLRKCNGCTGAYGFEERFLQVVKERSGEEPPPEFVERLQQYLKDEPPDAPPA